MPFITERQVKEREGNLINVAEGTSRSHLI